MWCCSSLTLAGEQHWRIQGGRCGRPPPPPLGSNLLLILGPNISYWKWHLISAESKPGSWGKVFCVRSGECFWLFWVTTDGLVPKGTSDVLTNIDLLAWTVDLLVNFKRKLFVSVNSTKPFSCRSLPWRSWSWKSRVFASRFPICQARKRHPVRDWNWVSCTRRPQRHDRCPPSTPPLPPTPTTSPIATTASSPWQPISRPRTC